MNYYPFHIGDFRSGTVNMSRQSRWIYRDMLDVYYDAECPLPLDIDKLCDEIGVEADDERRIVERLLRFKFVKQDDGYHHHICDKVIAEYKAKAETARANGKLGGRPPRKAKQAEQKPDGLPPGSDQEPAQNPAPAAPQANQEPVTSNQENTGPVQQLTLNEEGRATPVELSIAMRRSGVQCQPADPRLIALSTQGVTVQTVEAACATARKSKPGEQIALGYVVAILERWAASAAAIEVGGAVAPGAQRPGYESPRSIARRNTIDGLTGAKADEQPRFIDLN